MTADIHTPARPKSKVRRHKRQDNAKLSEPSAPIPRHRRRLELLRVVLAHANDDMAKLAGWIDIKPERLAALLSGKLPFSNEYAMHIEESLDLPAAWLDGRHGEALPDDFSPGNRSDLDEDDDSMPIPVASLSNDSPAVRLPESAQHVEPHTSVRRGPATGQLRLAPQRVSKAKQALSENRRANLQMLTAQRGAKQALASLANMRASRISLMTSGRKPVSNPFACAIEAALELPTGWLDTLRDVAEVPDQVWRQMGGFPGATDHSVASTRAALPSPAQSNKALANCTGNGARSTPVSTTSAANTSPVTVRRAPTLAASARSATTPLSGIATAPTPPQAASIDHYPQWLNGTPLTHDTDSGAVAHALSRMVVDLSRTGRLCEHKAFRLLGELIKLNR